MVSYRLHRGFEANVAHSDDIEERREIKQQGLEDRFWLCSGDVKSDPARLKHLAEYSEFKRVKKHARKIQDVLEKSRQALLLVS